MSIDIREQGYSANVKLSLLIDGKTIDVEQVNGSRLIIRGNDWPRTSTSEAKLVIKVDDHIKTRDIVLYHGISSRYVDFVSLPS